MHAQEGTHVKLHVVTAIFFMKIEIGKKTNELRIKQQ